MKSVLIALSLASSIAAQADNLAFPTEFAIDAAIDPSDPEYAVCNNVIENLNVCITSIGGDDALATADPLELVGCACCQSGSAISRAFSTCATYLSKEGGLSGASQASAFSTLYGICSQNAQCSGGAGGSNTPKTTASGSVTPTATQSSARGPITSATEPTDVADLPDSCQDLIGIINSCSNANDNWDDLGNKQQASCFCCKKNPRGSSTWNDNFDKFASTCADWAQTGYTSIYTGASRYATFCDNFSDVCEGSGAATTSSRRIASGGSITESPTEATGGADDVTVTVPPPTTTPNAAAGLRITAGAIVGAVAALVIAF